MEEIVNRVVKSPLVSVDLEDYLHQGERIIFDLKDVLFQGMILRERDFRDFIKSNDWSIYKDKNVGLTCSVEAIVPTWAYMLLVTKVKEYANTVTFGGDSDIEKALILQAVEQCTTSQDFTDKKVVIKGCAAIQNIEYAYTLITERLFSKVSSLMYGEPCSTVPVFKRKR